MHSISRAPSLHRTQPYPFLRDALPHPEYRKNTHAPPVGRHPCTIGNLTPFLRHALPHPGTINSHIKRVQYTWYVRLVTDIPRARCVRHFFLASLLFAEDACPTNNAQACRAKPEAAAAAPPPRTQASADVNPFAGAKTIITLLYVCAASAHRTRYLTARTSLALHRPSVPYKLQYTT